MPECDSRNQQDEFEHIFSGNRTLPRGPEALPIHEQDTRGCDLGLARREIALDNKDS